MRTTGRLCQRLAARTCGVLGIRLVHSKPYSPEGRGKQERLNRYIREAFRPRRPPRYRVAGGAERPVRRVGRQVANRRVHAETGRPDRAVLRGGPHRQASPDLIREAFRWSVTRRSPAPRTVPLEGNAYAVDPALAGRRVELRYDPKT